MEKEIEPKYSYGKQVYIKRGFYRGYRAEIKEYEKVSIKNQETNEEQAYILYRVKIDNVPLKNLYEVKEDWLTPYRKYFFF
jgi:hypothetical protein